MGRFRGLFRWIIRLRCYLKVFKWVLIILVMKGINYFILGLVFFGLIGFVSAGDVNVSYFYGQGCSHCAKVSASGVLDDVLGIDGVSLGKFDVGDEGAVLYNNYREDLGIPPGWPLLIIECGEESFYLRGDKDIIDSLNSVVETCSGLEDKFSLGDRINIWLEKKFYDNLDEDSGSLMFFGWVILILSALIDSINPCAFGVLIFLMLSLLEMGSAKRALKAGMVYTLVVFIVYFFAGFGIFKVIQQFTSVTLFIYLTAGALVLLLGLWQFKDVFIPRFGPTLQISPRVKPMIERIIQKGTIPAMIVLGIVVSLFELPCTGGIYLAVITILSKFGIFPVVYLMVYNFIFVLPLIVLTLLIYRGMSPEVLRKWTQGERKWMKIGSGIVLVSLGIYILFF